MVPQLKVIKNENDYNDALELFESLIDAPEGSEDAETMEVLSILIEKYEDEHYPIALPDPVEAIKFRMEQQGLTQSDLMPYIGSRSKVSEVLSGKRELTLKMIRALNTYLDIPAEVLLQRSRASMPELYKEWDFEKFPLTEMNNNGAFRGFKYDNLKDRAEEAIRFLVEKAGGFDKIPQFAYRKTDGMRVNAKLDYYSLIGWSLQVLSEVSQKHIKEQYNPKLINKKFFENLAGLSVLPEGPRLAAEYLHEYGIIFHTVPHLKKTYLDGASFLLDDGRPVISLTLRYDRLDNFWFVLFHELGHLYCKHLTEEHRFYADDLDLRGKIDASPFEQEADTFAEKMLLPKSFDLDTKEKIFPAEVEEYARSLNRHPAIVAGRIRYSKGNFQILSQMVGNGEVRRLF
jgi:HTH-type transcriptional regulator/antitoxin HigA